VPATDGLVEFVGEEGQAPSGTARRRAFLRALRGPRRPLRLERAQAGSERGLRLARLLELRVESPRPPLRRLELVAEARHLPGGPGLEPRPQRLPLLTQAAALAREPPPSASRPPP